MSGMRTVAMIPILLGSTRIPDKNLILVDGYPMAFYVIDACKKAGVFDEIYINSEHEEARQFSEMLGVKFFKRSPEEGGSACRMKNKSCDCQGARCQIHDHFITAFLEAIECDYFVQVHTTSPLLLPETIRKFTETLHQGDYNSLKCVEQFRAETFVDHQPINFSISKKEPTQSLPPTQVISGALAGWKTEAWKESYAADLPDDGGPTYLEPMGLFPLESVEALDADTWEDLYMVEACLEYRRSQKFPGKFRFGSDVSSIKRTELGAQKSGEPKEGDSSEAETGSWRLGDLKAQMGSPPWVWTNKASSPWGKAVFCDLAGESEPMHYHVTKEETWMVVEGEYECRFDNGEVIRILPHEMVCIERGRKHAIRCVSDEDGIRFGDSLPEETVYL